jgi:SSS family solute:Na+ symporter
MDSIDVFVLVLYLLGMVAMGAIFSKIKSTKDMFNAGGQSPWWLSGISAFMTAFSAGTFVVWGGIAYTSGAVAISILTVLGISSLFVGKFLAGRWKSFGYDSAAEFLTDRFGRSIVQFYTLLQGLVGVFTMGGAVYALSVIICALIPMPEGHFLADPATGNFSVNIASFILCIIIILITSGGGLWAVLVTDAVQFIILLVSVIAVVPLMLNKVGGIDNFVSKVPEGYFNLVNKEFSMLFLIGWMIIYFFKFGGEWGFIQRFSCVPTQKDARKSSYIFGVLYIVSPVIWMLPPMLFRTINPDINPEQAYIMACKLVLPAGMLGLMIAAMCSATASMVTAYLNVYAGAFTTEFYQSMFRKNAGEKELVLVGRIFTIVLGGIAMAGAFIIPLWGTYTSYILSSVALLSGPLILPTIWGIFSKKLNLKAAWWITFISIAFVIALKFGTAGLSEGLLQTIKDDERLFELVAGILVPLFMLIISELILKNEDIGWQKIIAHRESKIGTETTQPSVYPLKLCGISFLIVGLLVSLLSLVQKEHFTFLLSFGIVLLAVGGIVMVIYNNTMKRNNLIIPIEKN